MKITIPDGQFCIIRAAGCKGIEVQAATEIEDAVKGAKKVLQSHLADLADEAFARGRKEGLSQGKTKESPELLAARRALNEIRVVVRRWHVKVEQNADDAYRNGVRDTLNQCIKDIDAVINP